MACRAVRDGYVERPIHIEQAWIPLHAPQALHVTHQQAPASAVQDGPVWVAKEITSQMTTRMSWL